MSKKHEIEKEKLQEILEARKQTKDKREDKRLHALELRASGYTNEEIVKILQVHERTITRWIQRYVKQGLEGMRNKPIPGNHRNLSFEEEAEFLQAFEEQAKKGQIITVREIEEAYIKKVGHSIGSGQIYYVLKRHNWRKVMPRSKHPKKASEEVIEASKKLTHWQKS